MMDIKSISVNEINKPTNFENNSFNPDSRIDVNNKPDADKTSKYDVDKRIEVKNEITDVEGGSYRDVKKTSNGETQEVHHMPADSASYLERNDGPAIKMDSDDHRKTASCGSSREAREYQAQQKELINQGKFREAVQMDIDDIRDKFGNKYDNAISQMLKYVDKLEAEGLING